MTEENPFAQFNTDEPLAGSSVDTQNGGEENPFAQFNTDKPLESSMLGAAARSATRGVIPAATGLSAAGAGAELGASIGVFGGAPGIFAGTVLGGLGGMLAGSMAGEAIQDYAVSPLISDDLKKRFGFTDEQQLVDETKHPYASQLGGLVPYLVTSTPFSPVAVEKEMTALEKFIKTQAAPRAIGGGLMGAWELGQEALNDEVDWTKVATASAFGVIFNHQNKVGQYLHNIGARPVQAMTGRLPVEPPPPEPSRSMGGAMFSPRNMPNPYNPTLRELDAAGVMGPGNTEYTYMGVKRRPALEELFAHKRLEEEYDALYGPQRPTPDQITAAARKMEPELFAARDALEEQRWSIEATIELYRRPTTEQYNELRDRRSALESQLAETKNKDQQRKIRTDIRLLTGEIDSTWSRMQGEGSLDETLTRHYNDLAAVNAQIREQGRDIARAHRMAADALGAGDMSLEHRFGEEQPATAPAGAGGIAPELFTPAMGSKPPAESAPTAPAAPAVDIATERAKVARDAKKEMLAAGRPEDEAEAASQLIASRFVARANAFKGARGTPYELYLSDHARITEWDHDRPPPPSAPPPPSGPSGGGPAPTNVVRLANERLAAAGSLIPEKSPISEPIADPVPGRLPEPTGQEPAAVEGSVSAMPETGAQTAPEAPSAPAPAGPAAGDRIVMNGTPYKIAEIDDKKVRLVPARTKDGASELIFPRKAFDQMFADHAAEAGEVEGEKVTLNGETLDPKLAALVKERLAEQEAQAATAPPEPPAYEIPKAAPAKEPQTLLGFVRAEGGIKDWKGELRSQDMHKRYPGLVRKNGKSLDAMREAAEEAGYLPDGSVPDDLVQALLSDEPVYSKHDFDQAEAWKLQEKSKAVERELKNAKDEFKGDYPELGDDVLDEAAAFMVHDGLSYDEAFEAAIAKAAKAYPEWTPDEDLGRVIDGWDDAAAKRENVGAAGENSGGSPERPESAGVATGGEGAPREDGQKAGEGGQVKRTKRQIKDLLSPIRLAIKGWAFADESGVIARLRHGEELVAQLPDDLKAEGEALLADVREEAAKLQGEAVAGKEPTVEPGAEGKPQTVIPGAERITDRELAERRANQPMRGGNQAPGGMFDEGNTNQRDLFQRRDEGRFVVGYHGSMDVVDKFDPEKTRLRRGVFFSDKPSLAEEFALGKNSDPHFSIYDDETFLEDIAPHVSKSQLAEITEKYKEWQKASEAADKLRPDYDQNNNPVFKSEADKAAYEAADAKFSRLSKELSSIAGDISSMVSQEDARAPNMRKVKLDLGRTYEYDFGGKFDWGKEAEAVRYAQENGYDSITFKNWGKGADEKFYTVFDNSRIRNFWDDTLYQRRRAGNEESALGKIVLKANGLREIWLKPDANPSTIIHETGHDFLEQMRADAAHEAAPQQLRDDLDTIKGWLGWKEGQKVFSTKQHEKFARGFERYLYDGIAPSKELAVVFQRFANWLREVYRTVAGLKTPNEIPPEVRAVFDRLLAVDPHQVTIAGEGMGKRAMADIHTDEARAVTPERAGPMSDRAMAEARRAVEEAPRNVQDELRAAAERGGVGKSPAGLGGSAERSGGMAEDSSRPATLGGGGARSAGDRAESGGRSSNENAGGGDGGTGGAGAADAAGSDPAFTRDGRFVDKAGNIRLENLTDSESVKEAIKEIAYGHNGFIAERRGIVPDSAVLSVAEEMGFDGAEELVNKWIVGQAMNAEQIMALRLLVRESARDLHEKAKAVAGGDWKAVRDYAVAKERHIAVQRTVSGVTAEAGRALRAFRDISGSPQAKALEKLMREATGQTLYQLRDEASLLAALDSEIAINRNVRHMGSNLGEGTLEYATNNLISGPITHMVYTISNQELALWKALVETPFRAVISNVLKAAGRDIRPEDMTRFGEVWQQILGLGQGFAPAIKAAGQSMKVGLTTRLPRETMKNLPGIRPGQEVVEAPMVDLAYSMKEVVPDLFGAMRGSLDALSAYGKMLAMGQEGEPFFRWAKNPLYKIPDAKVRGATVPVGGVVNLPSRLVSSLHAFNRVQFYFMELNAEAFRRASSELETGAIRPEDFTRRMAELKASPDGLMIDRATAAATESTQMAPGGQFTQRLSRLVNMPIGGQSGPPLLRFIDPFIHISSNVLSGAFLKRTPLGFLSGPIRDDLLGRNGRAAQTNSMARMAAGTSVLAWMGMMKAQGYITGAAPDDKAEAATWALAGYQPYSIKIDGTWYPYHRLGVLGLLMGIGADLYDIGDHLSKSAASYAKDDLKKMDEELMQAMGSLLHSLFNNVFEESFMRGPSELMKAVEGGENAMSRYTRNFISTMFTPFSVGMSQVARMADPISRQARTLTDAIKNKIPGMSKELFPRRNLWGEPIMSQTSVATRSAAADPTSVEVYRLGVAKAPVERKIFGVELTDQQYDDYQRIAGRMTKMQLDLMVRSPNWITVPDPIKKIQVEKTIDAQREAARGLMMMKYRTIPQEAAAAKRGRFTTIDTNRVR